MKREVQAIKSCEQNGIQESFLKKSYEEVVGLTDGYFAVRKGDSWGCVDKNGRQVCAPKYERIWYFEEGFARVRVANKYGFIDLAGKEICKIDYDYVSFFAEGYAVVQKGLYYGAIDGNGKVVCPVCCENTYQVSQRVMLK